MEWVACVGIDWAEEEHAYTIQTPDGAKTSGRMRSSPEDVHEWVRMLRQRFTSGMIVVAIEQGRTSLLYALMAYEFLALVPINPRASKAYRESLRLSGSSSDPVDADLICDFAVKHLPALRVWQPDDTLTRKLRMLVETRRTLVDQRTGLTHTLAATLKGYFPQPLQWFGGEGASLLWVMMERWPTLEQLLGATVDEILGVLRAKRCRRASARAQELFDQIHAAVPLTRDTAMIEASSVYAQTLIRILTPLEAAIEMYDTIIASVWATHPDRQIFESLPGAGPVLAPRLAVAFGSDRERYDQAADLQCYSGIAPVTEKSGRSVWVHARWGYPVFLHQTFHEFAASSMPHCKWAHAFYQQQCERGAERHQAIRALAFRWIRILFRLWENRQPYVESTYIEALKKKRSPLVPRLAA